MDRFAERYRVNSVRKIGWDYSNPGYYFVTICTVNHYCCLGKIDNDKMVLSTRGIVVIEELHKTFEIRKNLKLEAWVVMPNHVHMLFGVGDHLVETRCNASLQGDSKQSTVISNYRNHPGFFDKINIKSNSEVAKTIRSFKGAVKRRLKHQNIFFGWQERYYDEIVTDDKRLKIIKYYINNNPKNWKQDKLCK
ncbi:MAG: transposase [Microgenomates group bacterium]